MKDGRSSEDLRRISVTNYESPQTISHIVTECPIRTFKGTPKDIHLANKDI